MKKFSPVSLYDIKSHPFWHCIFVSLDSFGDDGSYYVYYCSRCKKYYKLIPEMCEVVEEKRITNDQTNS